MLQVLPLVHVLGFRSTMDLEFGRNREIRQHNIPFQLQHFHLIDDLVGVIECLRQIMKELAHFILRFKVKLVVRETEAIAFTTFFIRCDRSALHIAGIYAK